MAISLRAVAIGLWVAFMVAMATWSNTDAAIVGAGIGTVALGALVGRWWVVLVPIVPGAMLSLGSLVADPEDYYEGSPGLWAAYVAGWTIVIAALLALGVVVRRTAGHVRDRRYASR